MSSFFLASSAGIGSVQKGLQLSATSAFHVTTTGNLFGDVVLHFILSNRIRKSKHLWVELNSLVTRKLKVKVEMFRNSRVC